jgi:hypothetical protein
MVSLWRSSVASEVDCKLFDLELKETSIFYDNQSCIKLSVNRVCHDKHIEIKYHYIQEMIQKGALKLRYVPIDE